VNGDPAPVSAHLSSSAGCRAARLLGWPGVELPVMTLFGCRVSPVVVLDRAAHRARRASGDGPQLDGDTLAVWEWPESTGQAPASVVALSGLLVPARGSRAWCAALQRARSLRGFGPTAALTAPDVEPGEVCRLEHALHGIGLVTTNPDASGPVVWAEPGRCARARRRTADRWLEELLYRAALDSGALCGIGDTLW